MRRSLATPPAPSTRPTVLWRSTATPLATSTRPLAQGALFNNTIGSNNVALGATAGIALTTGSNNICIGAGVNGVAGESNTTRIRNVYTTVANGRAVYVELRQQDRHTFLFVPIQARYPADGRSSETLFALKPVTFRYKKDADPSQTLSFGLIAEDVAQSARS